MTDLVVALRVGPVEVAVRPMQDPTVSAIRTRVVVVPVCLHVRPIVTGRHLHSV